MTATASFMKALFHGVIVEESLLPFPETSPHAREDVLSVLSEVDALFEGRDPAETDRAAALDPALIDRLSQARLFGLVVPRAYGGLGLPLGGATRVLAEVAKRDAAVGFSVGAHGVLGTLAVTKHGTSAQRERHLPALARGERFASFALAEPHTGSDASAFSTFATASERGYTLEGRKAWVTGGDSADLFTVFARTQREGKPKITAFLLDRRAGLSTTGEIRTLGVRAVATTTLDLAGVSALKTDVLAPYMLISLMCLCS